MIYFDNASTTKPDREVCERISEVLLNGFANPSSLHKLGFEAEERMRSDRRKIADFIGADEDTIYFTSGGTESNNMAVMGAAEAYKRNGDTVVTVNTEHPSVAKPYELLKERGFNTVVLGTDEKGYIDIAELCTVLRENKTLLVSIMHVNNEIGTVQDIESIAAEVKRVSPKTVFHTDGVQGFGKHKLDLKNIDIYTFSGHKIHAPKGIGGICVRKGTRLKPIIYGGQQQGTVRPGTENTAYISGFSLAAERAFDSIDKNYDRVLAVRNKLMEIKDEMEGVIINGDADNASPYILSLAFEDVRGEVLLHALEQREIYVSTGSACSSKNKKHLSVIDRVNPKYAANTVRFSFSADNTVEEAEIVKKAIKEEAEILRRYKRR